MPVPVFMLSEYTVNTLVLVKSATSTVKTILQTHFACIQFQCCVCYWAVVTLLQSAALSPHFCHAFMPQNSTAIATSH